MLSIILFIVKALLVLGGIGCIVGAFYDFKIFEWKNKPSKLLYAGILCIFIFVSSMCIDFVPANNVGVKWSMIGGTSNKTLNEGIVLKTPMDKIYTIPTTVQERTMKDVTVQTKDAQFLTMEVNVKFSVNKENAFNVYKRYENIDNLKQNIISNYSQKAIEKIVTQYNVIDVLGEKKNDIYNLATEELKNKLSAEGVNLVELTIKDMDAGDEIEKAIKAEAVAKKAVETAKQNKEKAKTEAETKLIQAQGEAKANAVKTKALTDKVLLEQWIEKWNGILPMVSGSDSNMIDISELLKNSK
ncbi:MAG: prohibitin family protein [Coprobacillus sp.]|nr:prohibitin family protein [Coprobacillus sp.]